MRLINVESMKMEEFFNETAPPYTILSHRWGLEEVSIQEWNQVEEIETKMQHIVSHDAFKAARHENDYYHESLREQRTLLEGERFAIKRKAGYAKIVSLAKVVRESKIHSSGMYHSCRYAWIDTCCIDKTNNAELSEAINSMFRWYKNALICYVYLVDISAGLALDDLDDEVKASNWFQRGWTLQELLAPRIVVFFDQGWNTIFDKQSKASLIAEITRINEDFLSGCKNLSSACTARKMSWAATRTTTRQEDLAYCLLGIFDVNIPLLYGEGETAFVRLQEEIIRQSGDLSIFAWGYRSPLAPRTSSMFAHSPADFIGCFDFMQRLVRPAVISMTNVTINVELPYIRPVPNSLIFIYADLNCSMGIAKRVFLPLAVYRDDAHSIGNFKLTKSIWFERRVGARPILISELNDNVSLPGTNAQCWVRETHTMSILKKDPLRGFVKTGPSFVVLDGFNTPSSNVVLDEVYPPHFLAEHTLALDFNGPRRIWYPGAIMQAFNTDEYDPVAYIKVSHLSREGSVLIVVRYRNSVIEDVDPEVRLYEWPVNNRSVSVADLEVNNGRGGVNTGGVPRFDLGVASNRFGGFFTSYQRNAMMIWASGDALDTS